MSTGLPQALRQAVLVQRLANERLDHRMAAHVQLRRSLIEFLKHAGGQIHVHPLNRGQPQYVSSFIA